MKRTITWDLSKLGSGLNDPEFIKERKRMKKKFTSFEKKWKGKKTLLTSPKVLKQALDEYEKIGAMESREDRYLFLASCLDTQNPDILAAGTRYRDFAQAMSDHLRFFELDLAKISTEKQKSFLKSPQLKEYHQFLKDIFESAPYVLSEKEERILSMKSSVSSGNWVGMLDEFLSGETRKVWVEEGTKLVKREQTFTEILGLLKSKKKRVTNTAITALNDIFTKHEKVAEKEMNSFLENKKINDELRGFERPDSARHLAEGIDTKAVDALIETVRENFKVSQDFYRFKAKLFKKKSFHYWERLSEYGTIDMNFSYPQSVQLVERALRRIGGEFADTFTSFTTNGQIDVFPKKGKTGGAFCLPGYTTDVNLMLNHTGSFRDVTTIAHEMGHGIHSVKSRVENRLNYSHPMCTAEVASTFCEDFVIDELRETLGEEAELTLLVSQVEDKVNTIFRQVAGYTFERELHDTFRERGYLTTKEIGEMFNKHMKSYMGTTVTFDEDSGRGWIYWSHFRNPFYVFAYSMALLVAQFARKKFNEDKNYLEKINQFYSTGSSIPPAEIFANLGLDVHDAKYWQEGIDEVKTLLKEAKKLAKNLKKV